MSPTRSILRLFDRLRGHTCLQRLKAIAKKMLLLLVCRRLWSVALIGLCPLRPRWWKRRLTVETKLLSSLQTSTARQRPKRLAEQRSPERRRKSGRRERQRPKRLAEQRSPERRRKSGRRERLPKSNAGPKRS